MTVLVAFLALAALMILRIPVGFAMGIVGAGGVAYIVSWPAAYSMIGTIAVRTTTDYAFGIIPMFLLMGSLVARSGISTELYRAANAFMGRLRGGLALATIGACGGFAAICGSSVATAATFSAVAYPEMVDKDYPRGLAAGVIAAGGTLGILIPPSTVLAVYGIITQQDIGKLFVAGILPGLLAMAMYMLTISLIGRLRPGYLPEGVRAAPGERLASLRGIWATLLLFCFVIGGLYWGLFTPTEAGAMGAAGAFAIGLLRGRLSPAKIRAALIDTTRVTAAIFTILIGALLFGYFLALTQTPQAVTAFLANLGLGPYGILLMILLMYLVLGCIMDSMAMIVLTLPIVFPIILELGFDPIWFGIVLVVVVELGIIPPPIGMNLFVIKSVLPDLRLMEIIRGVSPFIVTDVIRLAILIAFPAISLFLPSLMR